MKFIVALLVAVLIPVTGFTQTPQFNIKKDLLLGQFDCKTDVDDLHTVAAFTMLLNNAAFKKVKYHTVAGTYGIQTGLYVPPNPLFKLAFGKNWTDAHKNVSPAVTKVLKKVKKTFKKGGDIWIAEAGQSDFTSALITAIKTQLPDINTNKRVHVVQHSNWNEKSTDPDKLAYTKANTDYHKIPDGNKVGNGSPGFNDAKYTWKGKLTNAKQIKVWTLATTISDTYNGKDDRYENKTVTKGGLDFSDLSEVCYILGLNDIKDSHEFFSKFAL